MDPLRGTWRTINRPPNRRASTHKIQVVGAVPPARFSGDADGPCVSRRERVAKLVCRAPRTDPGGTPGGVGSRSSGVRRGSRRGPFWRPSTYWDDDAAVARTKGRLGGGRRHIGSCCCSHRPDGSSCNRRGRTRDCGLRAIIIQSRGKRGSRGRAWDEYQHGNDARLSGFRRRTRRRRTHRAIDLATDCPWLRLDRGCHLGYHGRPRSWRGRRQGHEREELSAPTISADGVGHRSQPPGTYTGS